MKTIGVLGGMSWESTALYYRLINEGVRDRLGGLHSASMRLASVDFHDIEALQQEGDWQQAGELLARLAGQLEMAGADGLLLATNTMHRVASDIETSVSIPLLHIADATARHARRQGFQRLGLLGTRFTMEQDFYRRRLAELGDVDVLVPQAEDRALVDRVIFDELCRGLCLEGSRREYRRICRALADQGAQAIVAGCTEIGMLIDAGDCPVPLLDTTRLHAQVAVDWMT